MKLIDAKIREQHGMKTVRAHDMQLSSRKFASGSLICVIVASMVTWFSFLGWGMYSTVRWLSQFIQ